MPPVNATDATFALQTANATNATTAAPVNAKLPILNLSDMSADECPMTEWLDVINEVSVRWMYRRPRGKTGAEANVGVGNSGASVHLWLRLPVF